MPQDKLYFKAKHEGYRARSVYKLIELQKKYHLIRKRDAVLDLGCAPGSWLQIVSTWANEGFVLGIDLSPVRTVAKNVVVWRESVMSPEIIQKLQGFLMEKGRTGFSIVLSDMAPKTKGIPYIDQQASFDLVTKAFEIAKEILVPGGNFVCKVFQSKEATDFLPQLKKSFALVKMMSVEATKKGSKEMYYLCLGYKV